MQKIPGSCPYCSESNGKDDLVINRKLLYADYFGAEVTETKICNICKEIYECTKKYKFDYETFGHKPFN